MILVSLCAETIKPVSEGDKIVVVVVVVVVLTLTRIIKSVVHTWMCNSSFVGITKDAYFCSFFFFFFFFLSLTLLLSSS